MDRARIPGLKQGERHPNWGVLFQSADEKTLPWYYTQLDPDIEKELAPHAGQDITVLDVGCGLGNQAYLISQLGFEVVASDISTAAIRRAQTSYPSVTFINDDIVNTALKTEFGIVIDRGCFHVLPPEFHAKYVKTVARLLRPRGVFLLKCLSQEGGHADFGPVRFSLMQMLLIFSSHFDSLRIHRTIYHGSVDHPPLAWFSVMRRKEIL